MDQALRNKLRRAVEEMRRTLERDVTEQLEGTYGITAERQGANGTTPVRLEAADEVATLREYPQRRQGTPGDRGGDPARGNEDAGAGERY